ncbi:receptor family ligand binding region domain-containing protein [Ditylenchus destructor]|uniref:guanylate cyclase n=1 Tax=Ditylenchus destructor TaxID=166010 RepID=A0AAD4R086_9BILA|nr:receptor family ligand binding region domain-containing protein [Ditylenchus destructor]
MQLFLPLAFTSILLTSISAQLTPSTVPPLTTGSSTVPPLLSSPPNQTQNPLLPLTTTVFPTLIPGNVVSPPGINTSIPNSLPSQVTPFPNLPGRNVSEGIIRMKVGLLFCNATQRQRSLMGFGQSSPAITIAIRKIRKDHLIDNIDMTFVWYMDNCNEAQAVGYTTKLIQQDGVDAIIGPSCATSAIVAGIVSAYYNTPMFVWGAATASELSDPLRFPTLSNVGVNTYVLGLAVRALLVQYNWTEFALLYTLDEEQRKCDFLQQDLEKAFVDDPTGTTIVYKRQLYSTERSMKDALSDVKSRARIILACFDSDLDKRAFLIYANDLGLNQNDEYVFIFPDVRSQGMLQRVQHSFNSAPGVAQQQRSQAYINFWMDQNGDPGDGRNQDALATARHSIVVDLENQNDTTIEQFNEEMISLFGQSPFFCTGTCLGNPANETSASIYSRSLHDATYMYAKALNRTLRKGFSSADFRNGTFLMSMSRGDFDGLTGRVRINENGTREPVLYVTALDVFDAPTVYLTISIIANVVTVYENYTNEFSSIWANRHGQRPLYKPLCGYTGLECPVSLALYLSVGGAVILILFICTLIGIGYAIRERYREKERLDRECQIPYKSLRRIPDVKSAEILKSMRSMHSSISGGTKFTMDSHVETDNHVFFVYSKEVVYAEKFPVRMRPTPEEMGQLRKLRQFDNDNVNKFYGLCMDGPMLFSVWKCCQRGSLKDVIAKETYVSDTFVMFALMRDIASGLIALHNSFIGAHGSLTSECCLINDRWQVKIGDHGLSMIRQRQAVHRKKLLWAAPEIIRTGDRRGTKEGDVYSFAIICSELINREKVWNGVEKDEEIEGKCTLNGFLIPYP